MGTACAKPDTTEADDPQVEPSDPRATPVLMSPGFLLPNCAASPADLCFTSSSISFGPHNATKNTPPPFSALFQVRTPSTSLSPSMLDMSPQSMLDMLPYPAVLVDPKPCWPLCANGKALALFGSADLDELRQCFAAGAPSRLLMHLSDEWPTNTPPTWQHSHVFESPFVMPDNKMAVLYSFCGMGDGSESFTAFRQALQQLDEEDPKDLGDYFQDSPCDPLEDPEAEEEAPEELFRISPSALSQQMPGWEGDGSMSRLH